MSTSISYRIYFHYNLMKSGEDYEFIKKHLKQYSEIERVMNIAKKSNKQCIPVSEEFINMVSKLDAMYYEYKYIKYGKQLTKK